MDRHNMVRMKELHKSCASADSLFLITQTLSGYKKHSKPTLNPFSNTAIKSPNYN